MSIFFRGYLYEDTFRNRFVARLLTFLYRSKIEIVYYVETYWLRFVLLVLLVISLCACDYKRDNLFEGSLTLPHVFPDTCVVDSQNVTGHDYLIFYRPAMSYGQRKHLEPFQVLHSPDCYCRFNRKFVVIKRNK